MRPTFNLRANLSRLTVSQIKQMGLSGLILDLDNTLMTPHSGILLQEIADWIMLMQREGIRLIILSNNHNKEYLKTVEKVFAEYNVQLIGIAKKPCARNIERAIDLLGVAREKVAIVGDRVITDMFGAMHVGVQSIFVHPLIGPEEFWVKRYARKLEYLLLDNA